jgi:glyoxylase-like metal-dependent hydrolase (beta-lactamase superfamily II)
MRLFTIYTLILLLTPFSASAEEQIKITKVKNNIYMLISPQGGNIVVSTGDDGVFLIDDQLESRSKIISDSIKTVTDKDIKFVLNTHYHFDHSGGNEFFGTEGAMIVAHNNVRKRLNTEQFISYFKRKMLALSKQGLPVVTFTQDITFHYNDDAIHIIHVPTAHTDGDAIAHFVDQNIIVAGDVIFNAMYPFIDAEHGGSVKGVIAAADKMISLANDKTLIVPGHGVLMTLDDLKNYRQDLVVISDRIEAAIKEGKTKDQIIAEKPTKEFDASRANGFIKPDAFVALLYDDLNR